MTRRSPSSPRRRPLTSGRTRAVTAAVLAVGLASPALLDGTVTIPDAAAGSDVAAGAAARAERSAPPPVTTRRRSGDGPTGATPDRAARTTGPAGAAPGAAAAASQPDGDRPPPATPSEDGDRPPLACRPVSLERRAAAVLMIGLPGVVTADDPLVDEVARLGVGGVLLNATNITSASQLRALTAGLAERLGPHVAIALDQEGGRVSPLARIGLGGPSARRLGRLDPAAIEEAGRATGEAAADLGVTMVLGPVADLDDGPAGAVIGDRSFGADPAAVGQAARRYAGGLRSNGLAAVAKHWPGHAMAADTHLGQGVADVTVRELEEQHLAAFTPLLEDGIESVMVGHVVYPALGGMPASLNTAVYRLLRDTGYDGPAMTDALGMGAIHTRWGFDRSPAMALAAGADVALANQGGEAQVMRDGIVDAVRSGRLPGDRLDEAVSRAARIRPGC